MIDTWTLSLSDEQRDRVASAVLQDARVEYEGGHHGASTVWHYLDGANDVLSQLLATQIPLPPLDGVTVEILEAALDGFDWIL